MRPARPAAPRPRARGRACPAPTATSGMVRTRPSADGGNENEPMPARRLGEHRQVDDAAAESRRGRSRDRCRHRRSPRSAAAPRPSVSLPMAMPTTTRLARDRGAEGRRRCRGPRRSGRVNSTPPCLSSRRACDGDRRSGSGKTMSNTVVTAPISPSRSTSFASVVRGHGHWPSASIEASSISTTTTGAPAGGRGVSALVGVEDEEGQPVERRALQRAEGEDGERAPRGRRSRPRGHGGGRTATTPIFARGGAGCSSVVRGLVRR